MFGGVAALLLLSRSHTLCVVIRCTFSRERVGRIGGQVKGNVCCVFHKTEGEFENATLIEGRKDEFPAHSG